MDPVGYAEQPTAVVLGANGFVGRNVCAALHAAGWPVVGVVRRAAHLPAGCTSVRLDVVRADLKTLIDELAALRPALVVNTTGAVWNVSDDEQVETNVRFVERLVRAVSALPGAVRLVHFGSAYEYGTHPGKRLTETLPGRPIGRYAQTKFAGTQVVARAVADARLSATVLRIGVSVGPFASRYSLLGGIARQLAARPAELKLPSIDGVRDIVDIRDVADAVVCAARADPVPPVVNIGSGVGVRLTEAVNALIRIAGPSAEAATVVRIPGPTVRRDAGVGAQPLDIDLARRALGWVPTRTVLDALQGLWDSVRTPTPKHTVAVSTFAGDGDDTHG